MNKLKKGDIFIYIILSILALTGIMGLRHMAGSTKERIVIILQNGQQIEEIILKEGMETREIRIDGIDDDYNIISITYDSVAITDASCTDRLCIKQGSIKAVGQSIVCLPNKVVVKIVGKDIPSPIDDVTFKGGVR